MPRKAPIQKSARLKLCPSLHNNDLPAGQARSPEKSEKIPRQGVAGRQKTEFSKTYILKVFSLGYYVIRGNNILIF